jgi:hypothetical protein
MIAHRTDLFTDQEIAMASALRNPIPFRITSRLYTVVDGPAMSFMAAQKIVEQELACAAAPPETLEWSVIVTQT